MKETMVRDGKHVFLRLEAEEGFDEGYEFRMITNNRPERLLKMSVSREGRSVFLDYNVSGLVSLESCAEETEALLYAVISALEKTGGILSEYLLSPDRLSLSPSHVFVRKETGQVWFCYVPGKEGSFRDSVTELMEFFMKKAAPSEPAEVLLLYGLYQKSREENVTPESLAEYWRTEKDAIRKEDLPPEIEDAEIPFPEEDVYALLGMEKSRRGKANPAKEGVSAKRVHDGSGRAIVKWKPGRKGEKTSEQEKTETGLGAKVKALWKKRKTEILVAFVLIVGAILILLR